MNTLLTAEDIAKVLQVSPRQVSERYAAHPDFPKPIRLPSPRGHGIMRWKSEDFTKWLNGLK